MSERKINLYGILEKDEELFQDVIDGKLSYTIAKSIIYEWMKEACHQTLELAAENATLSLFDFIEDNFKEFKQDKNSYSINDGTYIEIDKQSILNTINQIE